MNNHLIEMLAKIFMCSVPLVCCGAQITDIWYLIQNWNLFARQELQICAILFVVIHFILVGIITIAAFKSNNPHQIKYYWFLPLFVILVWTKTNTWLQLCNTIKQKDSLHERSSKQKQNLILHNPCMILPIISELLLQDIPQIIIQIINNSEMQKWGTFEIVSISFSGTMIVLFPFYVYIKCIYYITMAFRAPVYRSPKQSLENPCNSDENNKRYAEKENQQTKEVLELQMIVKQLDQHQQNKKINKRKRRKRKTQTVVQNMNEKVDDQ